MVGAVDCTIHSWHKDGSTNPTLLQAAEGFFVYGHPIIDGAVMDTMPNLQVISNQGVGIDHINLDDAKARGIPVGNTPGFVDGATADMAFALLLAAARYVVRGDHSRAGRNSRTTIRISGTGRKCSGQPSASSGWVAWGSKLRGAPPAST